MTLNQEQNKVRSREDCGWLLKVRIEVPKFAPRNKVELVAFPAFPLSVKLQSKENWDSCGVLTKK